MIVAVVIATLGRPEEVGQLLERLVRQTAAPARVILSVESSADLPSNLADNIQVVMGSKGSSAQRNRGMELVLDCSDVIVFFDDDFLPSDRALEGLGALFHDNPDIAGATGWVLADGVTTGGIDYDHALAMVTTFDQKPPMDVRIEPGECRAYGCNMAFRATDIGDTRFDENLPLYGWQEDVDFGARMRLKGRVVKTNAFAGVHRGVTRGRTSGVKFGFSQIVNPIYLVRKGTMSAQWAAVLMTRNLIANHVKVFRPESWIDRWGRVRGNWIGLASLVSGRLDPRKVLHLR